MDAQFGKFRDIAELGKGGMGDVFLTVAPGPAGFNKLLVVKRLRQSLATDPEFLRMFLNEARLAARLNHPNIVHTYDVGFDGSRHYIAMEYLEGQSLHRIIRRTANTGDLTLEMQLRVLADALAGLHYAHELADYDGTPLAIVHRDVSPANIFVLYDGQVKLVDFGIAKSANSDETKAGVFKGKIQYVSPEQFSGGPIDRRADIYSAGVVLWESATRRRMWKEAGDLTVMQRVGAGDVPLPSSVDAQVPRQLEAICMKALAASREDRYPTAAAMQADLEEFLRERGSHVSAREVGALTARVFADDRARVKLLVEDQVRAVREYPDPLSLVPTVMLHQDTGTRAAAPLSIPYLRPDVSSLASRRRKVGLVMGGSVATLIASVTLWPSGPRSSDLPTSNDLMQPNRAPLVDTAASHAAAPPAAAPTAVTPPPPSANAPQVRLTVATVPKGARVLVDDALLPMDGQSTLFPKDSALHKVRAEAAGFRAKAEWVRFESDDVAVNIDLEPARKRKESAAVAVPAPPATAAAPLDTGDPWKK